jgi:hypothetical protein
MVKHSTPLPGNLALCVRVCPGSARDAGSIRATSDFLPLFFFLALPSTTYSFAFVSQITSVVALRLLGEKLHL